MYSDQLVCLIENKAKLSFISAFYLLNINLVTAIFHSNVCELLPNKWQRFFMPEFGQHSIVALTKEEYDKASNEEGHEAALHEVGLRELDRVERLRSCGFLRSDVPVEL